LTFGQPLREWCEGHLWSPGCYQGSVGQAGTWPRVVSFMEKEILIKDISVEWNGRKVRGFGTKQEAQRFIKRICKKIAPNLKYSTYTYYKR
jgi:hypothetical protein